VRFTYEIEHDKDGNALGVRIAETGGYFANRTIKEVQVVAEPLYPELDPEFRTNAMQKEFYDIHFNHCVRRRLEQCDNMQSFSVRLDSEPAGV